MEPQQPGRANRLFSWCEAFELITVSEEDSVHSSDPDSADSGDEADFIEGRDPSYDIVDDDDDEEVGVSSPCIPEGGTGRGRGRGRRGGRRQSPSNRGSRVDDDDDEEEVGVSSPCIPEGGRGRGRRGGRSLSPVNRGSRSETLPGDAAGWRTDQVLCNGPGTCVPLCVAGLLLGILGMKKVLIVYVESICRVQTLSLTGKILYPISDYFFVQWPCLRDKYPKSIFLGRIV
ncbi:UDP-N-acetylglucosamine transferase subunit ALG14 homolog isoform X1 [Epinephelus fuscoguttatus]|uniref:UDP-N-acetylglucosamine transferase subunit ALG14 homolog isoform X1 n=1 Tax=Epinephelus fuscoguttatus TaxID=293821 RepID=UPI0020D00F1C|nr:UDP-N-acetylglucosamine transferase subunit ALG14 homolog isoform X1 [Epinephelus fuscoguttatus]